VKPFASLKGRICAVAALAAIALLVLGGLLLQTSERSRDGFRWVHHTQEVIFNLDQVLGNTGKAESSLRGYLLSDDASFLDTFSEDLRSAQSAADHVVNLVTDNPTQALRASRLRSLAAAKRKLMTTAAGKPAGKYAFRDPALRAKGKVLMTDIARLVITMRDSERQLLAVRTAEVERNASQLRALLVFGGPALLLLIGTLTWLLYASIARPTANLLEAVRRFGAGDRRARADEDQGSQEFQQLSRTYNEMAERLVRSIADQSHADSQLAQANAKLVERGRLLEDRQWSTKLLSEMSQRLQTIQNEGELATVLDCFLPRVFPDLAGALYVFNHSRNMLVRVSHWGAPNAAPETMPPGDCWALRRGQAHVVDKPGADIVCAHATGDFAVERRCEPVLAGGELLGLFYIEGLNEAEEHFRLGMLMENIALALVNDNLRSRLREQSIRDPLTKLFNRRYMEEALALEAARAARNASPLSIVMTDVDHFKRFNDEHGHIAGDTLLQAVAGLIQSHFRDGDIVCRYGGEEFTVIAPGASPTLIRDRVETLRLAVAQLVVEQDGRRIGPVTMSFGIDTWVAGDSRHPNALVQEADRALFRAKRLGRNRIEAAATTAFLQAAE
jgi:diguanylate cyclase (GGDEF)-like protein